MRASRLGAVCAVLVVLTGCATNHYGRQAAVTNFERRELTCRELEREIAEVDGWMQRVAEESRFGWKEAAGILGDFGIGNLLELSAAIDSATDRRTSLVEAQDAKGCASASGA